ncbi:MAG: HDOD domain-containing protein [Deltaproteobacteria bacterium]|jgi:putative nucleotidyltransferase with HDIG domain|nr:HDOD domain-containing protein [Deltaproteobacteria bacterium]
MPDDNRYHVAAGSYYIDTQKPMILEAYLGTCVGVALYDPVAGVGGLIHLLLPAPMSIEGAIQPEKYASTGFPLFLEALASAGASVENMKASIAGGALVGPLEDSDLELDIGGRTADRVMRIIAAEGIRVDKLETGGFFTCKLTLDMRTWECRIDPAGFDRLSASADIKIPEPNEISQSAENLQPIPQIALKLLRIVNNELYEIHDLTEEIRKDQVISARTLQLCNSVVFASRKKIESLDHALVMLGQQLLLKFVISASLNNFFNQSGMGYSLCKGGIYHHAVGTAVIAEKLAGLTGKVEPSLAYTAGLLHDIGKVVLDQYIDSGFPLFYRQLNEEGKNFSEVEKQVLGTDHTEVGASLALNWSFPESLVETIRHHHNPEDAQQHDELVHIVYLADLLMSRFHSGLELERLNTAALATRLEIIGLSITKFPALVDHIPLKVLESTPEFALMG